MKISIVAFDNFTDIDLWLMWDLLNRVKDQGWEIKILGMKDSHVSNTGITINMHGPLSETATSDVVLFVSGPGTQKVILDQNFLSALRLDPEHQMIGSMCTGALILAALKILRPGDRATTYPTAKKQLESFGIEVIEQAIVKNRNVATAAGCLAAQDLAGWVMQRWAGEKISHLVLNSIKPVGQGLYYSKSGVTK